MSGQSPARAGAISAAEKKTALRIAGGYRKETRALHQLMGQERPRGFYTLDQYHPERAYVVWSGRLVRARKAAHRPPHLGAWLCIHRHEGSWKDRHAPYYGGLQMDWGFMRAYGAGLLRRLGTADRWTPVQQMWVAERAIRAGRGFHPWPNTARLCGLL